MTVLELINDALVIKIKKTSKKALLFGALGLIILLILFFSFQSLLPKIVDQAFFITLGYLIIYALAYFIWLLVTSKPKYKTVTLDFNKFILKGKENVTLKHEGLALVSLDFSYSPDIYVSIIYNENVTYSFMIYKSAYPKLKEYLTQSRLNYEELNNS